LAGSFVKRSKKLLLFASGGRFKAATWVLSLRVESFSVLFFKKELLAFLAYGRVTPRMALRAPRHLSADSAGGRAPILLRLIGP
jgi:hypothetical protein